jgi:eukaryotic-like serine/threonine-protein kinase
MAVNVDAAKDGNDKSVSLRVQQAFRELRSGDRPLVTFLKEIDRAFLLNPGDAEVMRAALLHEAAQYTLPDDVLADISKRIESAANEQVLRGDQPPFVASVDITAESEIGAAVDDETDQHLAPVANSRGESNGKRTVLNERYVLIECVGVGGSSTVFKALDRRRLLFEDPSPFVAVKILNDKLRSRADWLEVLEQEAIKCHQLKHPNIIRVYDFLRDGQRVYITMEFLSGSPLTQIVRSKDFSGMPEKEALRIVEKMASALRFAHERGIVHRDFKPANIFRTDDGEVKLIDFGIAQIFGQNAATFDGPEATKSGTWPRHAVTPAYASPELLERRDPDPRDDVYSLACTTYELLTGTHPFGYKSALEARTAGLTVPPSRAVTSTQLTAIRHGLEFERDRRTPTIPLFIAELTAVPKVSHDRLLLAATMAVFIAGLTWLYFYHKGQPTTELVADSSDLNSDTEFGELPAEATDESATMAERNATTETTTGPGEATAAPEPTASSVQLPDTPTVAIATKVTPVGTVPPAPTKVQQLVASGYRQLAQGKLTAPLGDNAFASFQAALKFDRRDTSAQLGLVRISDRFRERALAKLDANDNAGSLALVNQGLRVNRQHAGLLKLRRVLVDLLAADRLAAQKGPDAATLATVQKVEPQVAIAAEPVPAAPAIDPPPPAPVTQPTIRPHIRIFGGF